MHELPFGFNANADANLTREAWQRVSILHDLLAQRRRGWARAGLDALVAVLSRQAVTALAEGLKEVRKGWKDFD